MVHSKKINLKSDNKNIILKKNKEITCSISSNDININGIHKLFFSCEDASTPLFKNESGAELLYMLIDDSLNYTESEKNKFCLEFSVTNPLPYAKRAVKKVIWKNLNYGLYAYENFTEYHDNWYFGISAKAQNLKIEKGGYVRVLLDVWHLKEGVDPDDTTNAPDERHIINIPEGTYPYTEFKKCVNIKKDLTACVIITVEAENYSGNLYFECPFICDYEGRNLICEFDRGSIGLTKFAWLGQNLSKREWPEFEIYVNGKLCFKDEVFLKVHRFSPVEIDLPEGVFCEGENTLSIKYTSDYLDVIPLLFDEILLLEKENVPFCVLSGTKEFTQGEELKLLAELKNSDVNMEFESSDFELAEKTVFDEVNLAVLSLKPLKNKNKLSFTLKSGDYLKPFTTERCIKKTEDNVISASGDMIYVDISDLKAVCDYLKWYVANDIGSFVTIRPVYRWGGQRFVNSHVWEVFTKLCESLNLKYVHISDGRDVPGIHTNPTEKDLNGNLFLGRQLHERDGQLFYWSPFTGTPREIAAPLDEFFDLAARLGRECPETIEGSYRPFNITYNGDKYSYTRKFPEIKDMALAHDIAADELKNLSLDNFTRHTGPAVMFKYFLQNGFNWVGAETMDSSTEFLLAFLRGASNAYDKNKYGVHLALQWSTFPHDNIKRYRRYLLSLYVPYMHGVTDINTEEGLWFMEARYAYHNRLSDACTEHRKQLQRFNKFVRTHSRTGSFHTPIAFLHGRYDGWNGFLVHNIWGDPSVKPGDDAHSWLILKSFYPLDALDEHGAHKTGFVSPQRNTPFGTFSGTPRGNFDAVPVEKGNLAKYPLLIFAGYNCAQKEDLQRISDAVKSGSTLLCTWAHFTDTTLKSDIENYKLHIVSHEITKAFSDDEPVFETAAADGKEIKVCVNTADNINVIKACDNGLPLVCEVPYGKGKIVLVNTLYYPGNDAIFPIYENLVKSLTDEILKKEDIQIECGEDVQYTVFNQENGTKHYYFTAVDWYNDSNCMRQAILKTQEGEYTISIPFGKIIKLVTDGKIAVWPENEFAEVISLNGSTITVQGKGKEKFYIAQNGNVKEYMPDFEESNTQQICL